MLAPSVVDTFGCLRKYCTFQEVALYTLVVLQIVGRGTVLADSGRPEVRAVGEYLADFVTSVAAFVQEVLCFTGVALVHVMFVFPAVLD